MTTTAKTPSLHSFDDEKKVDISMLENTDAAPTTSVEFDFESFEGFSPEEVRLFTPLHGRIAADTCC
jgi:hypothetical protein